MMTRPTCAALLACAVFFALAAHGSHAQEIKEAAAEEQGDATVLKKLMVRDATGKGVADTPLASETTAGLIENNHVTSFEDLGRSLEPGVGFNRANGSVNIRGLEGARVQTTIDGVVIPYLDDGARDADGGIDSFDFDTLSSVDVVRGADSSRAGDGALGGAVVLRTLQPEDLIGEGKDWGGIFKFMYDSEDRSFGTSAATATRFDNTAILFQGGYKRGHERDTGGKIDIYGAGRTDANPADFDQRNVLAKVKQYTDSGHTFRLTGERFDRNKDIDLRSEQGIFGNYRPGQWNGIEDTTRNRISLDYDFEAMDDDALFDAAKALFYWQDSTRDAGKEGNRSNTVVGAYSRMSEVENRSLGGSGLLEKKATTGMLDHTFRLSSDFLIGTTTQYSSGVDSCDEQPNPTCDFLHTNQSDAPDVDGQKFGLSVEDEIAFGATGFSLTPGLRYDWYDQAPQETASYTRNPNYNGLPAGQSDDALSPKLLAEYQAAETVELFAQWAMAFRSPTATELYLDYGGPGTYLRLGNPDLKPETSNGFEVGAILGDEDFGGRIAGFYNRYRNFIDTQTTEVQDPVNYPLGISQYLNLDRVRIYGVELSAHKRFESGFHVNAALSFADGTDLESGEKLRSVAPMKGILGAGYGTEIFGADVTFIAVRAVSQRSNAVFKAPGYGIVDLTGWWKPEEVDGLTVRAGVYNLFDKEYYDAINVRDAVVSSATPGRAFYSEPGRSFKLSLTQRF